MEITQQPKPAQQDFRCAEHTVGRAHGIQKGSHRGAKAEQHVPKRVIAVPAYRAKKIIQQAERHAQCVGKHQRQGLRTQINAHSAEQPRPEAALARRFLVA